MTRDQLAAFGRWAFVAGFMVGVIVAVAAVRQDWPWWLISAVGFAVAFAISHLAQRMADRFTRR